MSLITNIFNILTRYFRNTKGSYTSHLIILFQFRTLCLTSIKNDKERSLYLYLFSTLLFDSFTQSLLYYRKKQNTYIHTHIHNRNSFLKNLDTMILVSLHRERFMRRVMKLPMHCVRRRVIFDCLCLSLTTVSTPKAEYIYQNSKLLPPVMLFLL